MQERLNSQQQFSPRQQIFKPVPQSHIAWQHRHILHTRGLPYQLSFLVSTRTANMHCHTFTRCSQTREQLHPLGAEEFFKATGVRLGPDGALPQHARAGAPEDASSSSRTKVLPPAAASAPSKQHQLCRPRSSRRRG